MKIVQFIPALTKGGAESVVVELANQAAADGHDVTVLLAFAVDRTLMRDKLRPDVAVRVMNPEGRGAIGRYAAMAPWLWRERRWLLAQDIVHCHLTFASVAGTAIQILRRLGRRSRPRVVETFHSIGMPLPRAKKAMFRRFARVRDGYGMIADEAGRGRFFDGTQTLPLVFAPNGIDTDIALPSAEAARGFRSAVGIPERALVVGTVGRIIRDRAPMSVVAAFGQIAEVAGPDVHFFIGGEGPMTDEVRTKANRLGIADRLHLPGLITQPTAAFANIDLYLTINVGTMTGVAALEAAACGLPVIAVNTRADHDGGSDWIWSDADPVKVGNRAAELLADRDKRAALARVQQAYVRAHYSGSAMWQAYEGLYRRALADA